ncbi:MAG: hypothetical protein AB7O26_07945 [Planctomycetaceae bacterium]
MSRSLVANRLTRSGLLILIAVAMAGVILIAGPLLAQNEPAAAANDSQPKPEAPRAAKSPTEVREMIEAKIVQETTRCNFTDTPLTEAMQFLAAQHQLPFLIEVPKLEEQAVAADHPLNQTLSDVTLDSALSIILKPLQLTYLVEDEVVKITTIDRANDTYETRVYDTRSLKGSGFESRTLEEAILLASSNAQWRSKDKEAKESGGGAIIPISDGLIVCQTQAVHRDIAKLFRDLEHHAARRGGSNPPLKGQASVPPQGN